MLPDWVQIHPAPSHVFFLLNTAQLVGGLVGPGVGDGVGLPVVGGDVGSLVGGAALMI